MRQSRCKACVQCKSSSCLGTPHTDLWGPHNPRGWAHTSPEGCPAPRASPPTATACRLPHTHAHHVVEYGTAVVLDQEDAVCMLLRGLLLQGRRRREGARRAGGGTTSRVVVATPRPELTPCNVYMCASSAAAACTRLAFCKSSFLVYSTEYTLLASGVAAATPPPTRGAPGAAAVGACLLAGARAAPGANAPGSMALAGRFPGAGRGCCHAAAWLLKACCDWPAASRGSGCAFSCPPYAPTCTCTAGTAGADAVGPAGADACGASASPILRGAWNACRCR